MEIHIKNYIDFFDMVPDDIFYCEICGINSTSTIIDFHHICKRSDMGSDTVENIICLCRSCHNRSHKRELPYISEEELSDTHMKNIMTYLENKYKGLSI